MGGNLAFINRLVRCTTRSIDFMDYTHEGVRLVVNLAHEVGVCLCALRWFGGEGCVIRGAAIAVETVPWMEGNDLPRRT